MRLSWTLLLALEALGVPAAPPPPGILNASVETRSAAAGLEGVFRGLLTSPSRTAWVGYEVPATGRQHRCGCGFAEGEGAGCRLEGGSPRPGETTLVLPGAPARLRIFLWIDGGRIRRLRMHDEDCTIDLCGQPLVWLTEVQPRESVGFLASLPGEEAHLAGPATIRGPWPTSRRS
jgi:hypothetical protein